MFQNKIHGKYDIYIYIYTLSKAICSWPCLSSSDKSSFNCLTIVTLLFFSNLRRHWTFLSNLLLQKIRKGEEGKKVRFLITEVKRTKPYSKKKELMKLYNHFEAFLHPKRKSNMVFFFFFFFPFLKEFTDGESLIQWIKSAERWRWENWKIP